MALHHCLPVLLSPAAAAAAAAAAASFNNIKVRIKDESSSRDNTAGAPRRTLNRALTFRV
jgi:hypothetical protein